MLRIAIVEHDQDTCDQLQVFIRRYARETGQEIAVTPFDRAERFLAQYQSVYDIVFMGIELPGLDGMEAARRLRKRDADVVLVFVTALAGHAIRGYEVDALDFVLKPMSYYALSMKLERAISRVRQRVGESIALKTSGGVRRLEIGQIYYLETRSRMLYYHTASGVYPVRASLNSAMEELAPHSFAKCNQCYLVNLQHVTDMRDDTVTVAGEELEISRRSRKSFMDALVAYIGGVR